jgi:DNA invertase Pin-like site-specific DNA recombinase
MIEECKNGNVDIVLCKTQARFARDMELVEKYIHNLFHEWNVRFIQR